MVLRGTESQIPFIKESRNLGYYVIVCDLDPNNPGVKLADKYYSINICDKDAVFKVAREEQIDGIVSNYEAAMVVVAYVSEKLGLVGTTENSIKLLVDKNQFRKLQKAVGVFAPTSFEITSFDKLLFLIDKLKFPIIIKPSESCSSRGTTKIFSSNDVEIMNSVFNECVKWSRNKKVVIEEYVEMNACEAIEGEIFVHNGEIIWDGMFYDLRNRNLPMVPMTSMDISDISKNKLNLIKESLTKVIKGAGIKYGEYNPEMYFTKSGDLFIIEINVRQGGNNIPQFVESFTGINLNKLMVTTSMGDDAYWNELMATKRNFKNVVRHIIFSRKDGIYQKIHIADELKDKLIQLDDFTHFGSKVNKAINATDSIAVAFLNFSTKQEQRYFYSNMEKYIYPVVK